MTTNQPPTVIARKNLVYRQVIITICGLVLVFRGGIGYYATLKNEELKRTCLATRASQRTQAAGGSLENATNDRSKDTAAQRALAAFEANPEDIRLEQAAAQAIGKLSGKRRSPWISDSAILRAQMRSGNSATTYARQSDASRKRTGANRR